MSDKFYKNKSYMYLYNIDGWFVIANDMDHLKGLFKNRSGTELDESDVEVVANNITVIEKECNTYKEATGIE